MNREIAGLFDKFYSIALKDHIKDPILHSEWQYFQSMLSSSNFERDRVKMYLNILEGEKKKKESLDLFNSPEPKLEKRYSEPYRYSQGTPKAIQFQDQSSEPAKTSHSNHYGHHLNANREPDFKRLGEAAESILKMFEISATQ